MHLKHFIGLLALTLILVFASSAYPGTMEAPLRYLLEHRILSKGQPVGPGAAYEHILALETDPVNGELRVGVILHLEDDLPDLSTVDRLVIGSVVGRIATARLPVRSLSQLESLPGIRYIEASKIQYPANDVAMPAAKVTDVWNGSPAYTGSGVLVGIIDSGIDWTHDDFKHSNGTTRIKAIWDLYGTGGTPPAGFGYGVEYTESQINSGTVNQVDLSGHGTHVAGTAAGNGRASGGQYKGVAYEADILVAHALDDVGGGFHTDKTIDAINYMVQKAQSLGQPIVINMSLGGHWGAHDGTDAQEQVIDDLSGEGIVFCVAAGNEGGSYIHDSVDMAAGDTLRFTIASYTPRGTAMDYAFVDIWVDGSASPSVSVAGCPEVTSGNAEGYIYTIGTIYIDNASQGVDPNNGDKKIRVQIHDNNGYDPAVGSYPIVLTGASGTAHAWNISSSMLTYFPHSDQSYSVGMPGTAEEAITVAAYKTRNSWPSINGTSSYSGSWGDAPVGDKAPFSSEGPTRDSREKPDVSAPGMAIVSCYSADQTHPPDNDHLLEGEEYYATQGTSMATPLTAGIVALMFEKNGSLTAAQIRDYLRANAISDSYTGTTWNRKFGAGKVDALASMPPGPAAGGDANCDGETDILDVIILVNYILDSNYDIQSCGRQNADVYPAPNGDGTLNASDLSRIISFILKMDTPGSPVAASGPAMFKVGACYEDGGKWWVPVSIAGDAIAAGQFALSLEGADWISDGVSRGAAGQVEAASHNAGKQIRILFYDYANEFPADGITVRIPFEFSDHMPGAPELRGLLIVDAFGFEREVEVEGDDSQLPGVRFLRICPNPAPSSATISYHLGLAQHVELVLYDVQGQLVRHIESGPRQVGIHSVVWDGLDSSGSPAAPGIYLCRLLTPGQAVTRKVLLSR